MAASGIRLPRDIEKWLIWIVLAMSMCIRRPENTALGGEWRAVRL